MLARNQLVRKLSAQLSATVLERLLQAVALILIARQVGPTAFGPYAAALALTKMLSVGFGLGLDNWLLRNGFRQGDPAILAQHATNCLTIRAGLGLVWLALLALIAPWLDPAVYPLTLLLLCALIVWAEELANVVWSAFKAALQNQLLLRVMTVAQAAFVLAVLGLMLLGVQSIWAFAGVQLLITTLHALVAIWLQIRRFGWQWQPRTLRPILRESVPFALSTGLAMIYGRADIALVGLWLGERAVGLYSPAVSLANALALIPTAVYYVMLPVLSRAVLESPRYAARITRRLVVASTGLGLLVAAGLAIMAPLLVGFMYGAAFATTGQLLVILSGVLAARFVSMALATTLVAVGQQTARVIVQTGIAVLNIGLNVWAIRQWGLTGAAAVYVITEWLLALAYLGLVWSWYRTAHLQPVTEAS